METGHGSHIGRLRRINQDSYTLGKTKDGAAYFAVADGLGGHKGGEIASRMLIDELDEFLTGFDASKSVAEGKIQETLKDRIKILNSHIMRKGRDDESLTGMGSTLTFCLLSGGEAHVFHVGDSRLYRIGNNIIEKVTKDHSYVEELIDSGEITRDEAEHHPNKNLLTRAVGTDESLKVDYVKFQLRKEDIVLICSDGLTNYASEEEIKHIVLNNTSSQAVSKMIQTANDNGGGDNITAIVFKPEVY
ncbi:Stp1/IreP family PP2C-type Ser/Thr phosphatase [Alkalibacter saccharofermentans]|uniref:Protein phosphatase n=1 Tax=Alkalibacter saccharofermentans DSM 14828 TaxID=1120975 RepID=A0A1M4S562_9FIRM|nr:Stp1/IreP family PP2C-type Ser/Thr phosphatase [Alkalibacter saccharofermentans]SHE27319.1 protein phosphatase [Alkalibacter saccharofermentans DSM 14828]